MMTAMQTQTKPERKPDALDRAAQSHQAAKVKAEQYRVSVQQSADNSQILILGKDGAAENTATARRILTLLHEQLR